MAITRTSTLLSLDQYADIMQLHPDHFNQVFSSGQAVRLAGGFLYYQYGWNHDGHVSRDQIARAIAEAERLIATELGFWPAPKYITNEQEQYTSPRVFPPERYSQGGRQVVQLKWGQFVAAGWRTTALIEAGVDITAARTDTDGDDWAETVTFSVTHASASSWLPKEIGVFAAGDTPDDLHRIRDLTVSIDDTTITVTGRVSKFVKMAKWETNKGLDGDDADIFLASVDVYRIYTIDDDDNPPVEFGWEKQTEPTQYGIVAGTLQPVKAETSLVSLVPSTWDEDTEAWVPLCSGSVLMYGSPKVVRYNYLAGWATDAQGRMAPPLDRAVAALATARLPGPITCGGESIDKIYNYWQEVPTRETAQGRRLCPFGPQRGAWEAWETVQSMRQVNGFSL